MTTAQTHEDTLTSSRALKKREDFTSWKQKMQMIALAKCDGYPRIFFNDGMTPAGQAEYTGLTATNRRKWDVACTTIFGEIGKHIEDSTLLRLWSDTYAIVMAGNPLLVPHVVALCMVALESECLRDNDTAKLIASKELDIALNSFIADDGFTAFADRVATAHTKCQRLGMPLTDLKTRFFTGFRCSATASWTTLIEIWQSGVLTFDEIMQRGRDHQASLDLEKTTATASGVAAHLGARGKGGKGGRGKGGKSGGRGRGRGNHQGAYWASHNKGGKGGSTEARKAARTARAVVVVAAVAEMDVAAVETFKAIAIGVESMDIALLTVESILVEMQMSVLQTTRWSTTTTTTITTTPVVATTTTTTTTMEMAMEMAMGRFSLLAEWRAS